MAKLLDPRIEKVLITQKQIEDATTKAAKWIDKNYRNKKPILIAILKGAVPFYAKVLAKTTIDVQTDFVIYTSFAGNVKSIQEPKMVTDLRLDIRGRHVVILEDLIDSGKTLKSFIGVLKKRKPASVKLMVLCDKKCKRTVKIDADFVGYDIPDKFVVGFGMDYQEYMRNLPYVGVLKKEIYETNLAKINRRNKK